VGAGAFGVADATSDLEAVEVGEHDVEHDEVRPPAGNGLQGASSRGGPFHLEAVVAQAHGHQLGDVLLVIDNEDSRFTTIGVHPVSTAGACAIRILCSIWCLTHTKSNAMIKSHTVRA